jgi:phosphoserine aminotransferase
MERIYNFSAGPAVMPLPVLEEAQRDFLALPGIGMSVMEISHRSRAFDEILHGAEADLRALGGIPANYKVLFLQGGATLQFAMVPMNLLGPGASADYIVTGVWSQGAVSEAKKIGSVRVAGSTEAGGFRRVPTAAELDLRADAAYVHVTSNNTIYGTEWRDMPDVGDVPLVCDGSSDIYSQPIDVAKFGLIYAGAQKNLGPSGVTVVIIREDLIGRSSAALPTLLSYRAMAESGSRYNTPPVFGIYMLRLVMKWLIAQGGLSAMAAINSRKAAVLYAELDRSSFWRPHADKDSRSRMNVTFRLPSAELDARFVNEATSAGFDGLKGHRLVGGMRASLYNAFPEAGVHALVEFMREFERRRG